MLQSRTIERTDGGFCVTEVNGREVPEDEQIVWPSNWLAEVHAHELQEKDKAP